MFIFYPKPECFVEPQGLLREPVNSYEYDKTEYDENGIEVYYKGCLFPHKGMPFPEAIQSINILKTGLILIATSIPLSIKRTLNSLDKLEKQIADNVKLKDECFCPVAREVKRVLEIVLEKEQYSVGLATIIALIIQYDDAYRYRFQDIMNETNLDNLYKKPIRELYRLINIFKKRDNETTGGKIVKIIKPLILLLLVPKFYRIFRETILNLEIEKLQMDKADKYFCLNRGDYDYFGQTLEERQLEWYLIHGGNLPKQIQFTV